MQNGCEILILGHGVIYMTVSLQSGGLGRTGEDCAKLTMTLLVNAIHFEEEMWAESESIRNKR